MTVTATRPLSFADGDHRNAAGAHRRESSRAVTARHRIKAVILIAGATAVFYGAEHALWPRSPMPRTDLGEAWSWLGLIWAVTFIPAACELAGLLMWRAPHTDPRAISKLVCWRIVSRGINKEALRETIQSCRLEMARTPMFPYVIEVIVDTDVAAGGLPRASHDLHYIRVPADYRTRNGTVAKARALHYALAASPLPPDAWIVHLDEETRPTPSGIQGIAAAIREEEISGRLRIGQGTITYHRDWGRHPFFTLSDCIRTGSDLGRLYLSMRIGAPLFGLHGSFIVIRNDVEQSLGFDVGAKGSLTEDAWWGMAAMEAGYRCRWVEGHLAEQCTHRVPDFLRQRRRWFTGLARTAWSAPASLRWRAVLLISLLAWASAPLGWLYTMAHLASGGYTPPVIRAMANLSLAVYIATTIIGLGVNMREHGIRSRLQRLRWTATWLVCLPLFSLLESTAVAFALARPARTFHVVRK